jgi:isopentenyl-diphosphate delta-isomerase
MRIESDFVVLVDENDKTIGTMEKLKAHELGLLHRAFSVFIFNENDELLIHQRAFSKYHSGGLWTNTCCSHPKPDEDTLNAANRRLMEEMGIECELNHAFSFTYKAELDNQLTEHEFDHVYIGYSNEFPKPNPDEVNAWKYVSLDNLLIDLYQKPDAYTEWFKIIFERVFIYCTKNQSVKL